MNKNQKRSQVLVSGPLPPPLGGMETYCEEYLKTNLTKDFSIVFLQSGLIKIPCSSNRFKMIFLKCVNRAVTMLIWVANLVARCPDLVHVHTNSGPGFYARCWMIRCAKMLGIPSLLHMHGASFKEFYAAATDSRKRKIVRLLHLNTRLIVLSQEWQDFFLSIGVAREKIVVMPNSVFVPSIVPKGGSEDKLVALFMSRIEKRKGIWDILDVIDANRDLLEKYKFVIAGPYTEDYLKVKERLVLLELQDVVTMPGPLTGEEKSAAYRGADIYLLPSYAEGLPIGLLEAMSYQLSCITTPVGGIPDLIVNDESGLMIEPGNSVSLAAALRKLHAEVRLRKSLGKRARQVIQEGYSWQQRSEEISRLYTNVINKVLADEVSPKLDKP